LLLFAADYDAFATLMIAAAERHADAAADAAAARLRSRRRDAVFRMPPLPPDAMPPRRSPYDCREVAAASPASSVFAMLPRR
jgi:hypothetical protein